MWIYRASFEEMVKIRNYRDLDKLRSEMLDITLEIIFKIQKRMEISEQIGDIKRELKIDIEDEKVEQDVRKSVLELSKTIRMDPIFSGRLLNMLLLESIQLQQKQQEKNSPRHTHLSIFMKAKQLEASGKKIIHLEVGEPDYPAPKSIKKALIKSYNTKQYHYTDPRGVLKLRQAIGRKIGCGVEENEVIITAGGRFAIFSAIISLLKPGEEVISIEPSWPAYKEFVDFVGGKMKILRTTLEEKWTPDINQLRQMIGYHTKIIIINYPNNPTGKVLDEKNIAKIVSLAKDNGLYIISDEVYSDYAFNGFKSILEYGYDKSVMVSSFSKAHAMTGFRVGYGVANKEIIGKMARIQAITLTSVAEPMQHAALAALDQTPAENVKLIKKRLDLISNKLHHMSLPFIHPDGAMYVYPKLKGLIEDDITLVEKLLDLGVAIAPGSGFGQYYRQFIRISACQPEYILEKGLETLRLVLFTR
jgi:aspartate aminotransferase